MIDRLGYLSFGFVLIAAGSVCALVGLNAFELGGFLRWYLLFIVSLLLFILNYYFRVWFRVFYLGGFWVGCLLRVLGCGALVIFRGVFSVVFLIFATVW